tara:strand:+ start:96 stop:713 length:618 start_codon:yes stop_codon:yes gene_type:complete
VNITKLLLIEAALTITAIPILFLLQSKNHTAQSFIDDKLLKNTHYKLPEIEKLLELEKLAILKGSGIEYNLLIGDWKFISVWKKNDYYKDSVFSYLLRVFSATLKFKEGLSTKNPTNYLIKTSIQFGIISMEFSGSAYLKGKQPLLSYFIDLIEFKLGSLILLSRSLNEPVDKNKPFFSMIASKSSEGWLSARGQGGALVIWSKD